MLRYIIRRGPGSQFETEELISNEKIDNSRLRGFLSYVLNEGQDREHSQLHKTVRNMYQVLRSEQAKLCNSLLAHACK